MSKSCDMTRQEITNWMDAQISTFFTVTLERSVQNCQTPASPEPCILRIFLCIGFRPTSWVIEVCLGWNLWDAETLVWLSCLRFVSVHICLVLYFCLSCIRIRLVFCISAVYVSVTMVVIWVHVKRVVWAPIFVSNTSHGLNCASMRVGAVTVRQPARHDSRRLEVVSLSLPQPTKHLIHPPILLSWKRSL